jgi:CBS domain containing-hemolysin-like protein
MWPLKPKYSGMKSIITSPSPGKRFDAANWTKRALLALTLLLPGSADASIFKGEALDTAADVLTWVVLVIAPLVGIGVFLLVHILPEKIAEKKGHPQAKAIQCLCLLSLVFGGILWPLAWLWAYTKPVMHKLAYGTDKVEHGHGEEAPQPKAAQPTAAQPKQDHDEADEMDHLRRRVAELETELADKAGEKKRF